MEERKLLTKQEFKKLAKSSYDKNGILITFENVIMDGITISNINLPKVRFENVQFINCSIINCNFSNTRFRDCEFYNIKIRKSNFESSRFINCEFYNNTFVENILETSFDFSHFKESKLNFNYLNKVSFEGVRFINTKIIIKQLYRSLFWGTVFKKCDIIISNIVASVFIGADFSGENNIDMPINYNTIGMQLTCPEHGLFIGYKLVHDYLIKLEIPASAKRSSATGRQCRCSKAKVLEITNITSGRKIKSIYNKNQYGAEYTIGEMVYPDSYDNNRWNECSHGIHFFITKQEALDY